MLKWNQTQLDSLKEFYPNNTSKFCAEIFSVKISTIIYLAKKLGIKKDWEIKKQQTKTRRKIQRDDGRTHKYVKWTRNETQNLEAFYPDKTIEEYCQELDKTKQQIKDKIYRMGLHKK